MRFHPLERLINLHDGYSRQFKIDHLQLVLTQVLGELYLFEANCPHRGHSLQSATIDRGVIHCPVHQYAFSARDGRLLHASEEPCRGLRIFEVVYSGNEVGLVVDD